LGAVIENAYRLGAVYDGWTEHFKYDNWLKAFEQTGMDLDFYTVRERPVDEILPWDFIDMGVTRAFLMREWERARSGQTTPNCREACAGCGVNACGGMQNRDE
jgi:hypothetical protein